MKRWAGAAAAVVFGLYILGAQAEFPTPDWGDPPLTTDIFTFAGNDNPAVSDAALRVNPFGAGQAHVLVGDLGAGWLGPGLMSRDGVTGVWDLGRGAADRGMVAVRVPVAPDAGLQDAVIRVFVEVIGYVAFVELPTLHLNGAAVTPARPDLVNQPDPPGAWIHRVWETDVAVERAHEIEFVLRATDAGSTLDRIAVYTQVVWAADEQFAVEVSASPAVGGTVEGGGVFDRGSSATVRATPASGYRFRDWTEGGVTVSTSAAYSFTLTGHRVLVAHFRTSGSPPDDGDPPDDPDPPPDGPKPPVDPSRRTRLDFSGDGRSDLGVYHPPSGNWHLFLGSEGLRQEQFGFEGTIPVAGDFDGDGRADFGVYHPPSGSWYLFQSTEGFFHVQFGFDGTIPVVGDFDGDGRDDFGVYHPPSGMWYLFQSTEGFFQVQFGFDGTIPIVGDFDGDGRDDFGCYHPPSGMWYVFMSREGFRQVQFGFDGTIPIVGDFDGDGRDDFGCYHPPSGSWYIFRSRTGFWQTQFGFEGTIPVIGDFDGDGLADLAVYDPPSGNWFLFGSRRGFFTEQFGYSGTLPVGGPPVPAPAH